MKLYRGTSEFVHDGVIQNDYILRERRPRNLDSVIHEISNNWFAKNFGIKARSQTIFCSPCLGHAKEYKGVTGSLLEINLTNDISYSLIFSLEVYDFLSITEEVIDLSKQENILEWLESKNYQKVNCIDAIPKDFNGEIMLFCEKYMAKNI